MSVYHVLCVPAWCGPGPWCIVATANRAIHSDADLRAPLLDSEDCWGWVEANFCSWMVRSAGPTAAVVVISDSAVTGVLLQPCILFSKRVHDGLVSSVRMILMG